MQIRPAVKADAAALAQLATRTFVDAFAKDNSPEDVRAFCAANYSETHQSREIADPGLVTLVAEHDKTLIAFAQIRPDAPFAEAPSERCAELCRLYVDRAWHGRGLAQALMREAHDVAMQHNAPRMWLGVWEHNARAIAFYAKLGFRAIGEKSFQVGGDLQRDLVMAAPVGPEKK